MESIRNKDVVIINMLLALNNIPVVIRERRGTYQAYSTQTGRVLLHKKDMIDKNMSPLGILAEIAHYTKDENIITIARMMFKGNRIKAWRALNS